MSNAKWAGRLGRTMNPPREFSAVVLAGGRSRRMGADKALLEVAGDGVPLWRRQRDMVRAAGATAVFLAVRAEQAWRGGADGFDGQLLDARAVGGPLIGVTAGLERAAHGHLAVLAIDLPRMTAAWFRELHAACGPGVGGVGRRADAGGYFEPLAAIYPQALLPAAAAALGCGEFSLQRLVAAAVAAGQMRVREIGPEEAPLFENWNAPADVRPPPQA